MAIAILFDLIILTVLIVFAVRGAHRGLILSLCGLLAVLVAFVGASFAASTLSPMVGDALEPKFAAAIEEQLDKTIQQQLDAGEAAILAPDDMPLDGVLDALREMGFYESLIDSVDQAVEDGLTAAAASAAAAVATAIAQQVAYLILFLAAFVLILLAWRLLSRALDLVAKLPGLHLLNRTGGALFGLIQACIVLFVAAWLLQFLGHIFPEELVEETVLLQFFLNTSPLSLLSGL